MPVELHGVGHRFPGREWLFRSLSARLEPGRVHALVGPSGSGKSTLLGIIAGWIPPAEGSVSGRAPGRTSWVFQNPHGVARRTALDHVMLPLLAAGASIPEARDRAHDLLGEFRLGHLAESRFRELSGGEAQRLMLARGTARSPRLLLIDEPTAQLDPRTAETVSAVLGRTATPDTVVVVATHDAATRDACDRVLDLATVAHVPLGERVPRGESGPR